MEGSMLNDDLKKSNRQWKAGLFSCTDSIVPNCAMTWCCPCISYGQITHRIGYINDFIVAVLIWIVAGWNVGCCMLWHLRHTIRMKNGIEGSALGDCCVSTWCSCCAMGQMATEVGSYKPNECTFGAPSKLEDVESMQRV